MGKLTEVLPHLTSEQAEHIRQAIVTYVNRPTPSTFYVYPGWSTRDENFMYHGAFFKTFDARGMLRGKIARGSVDTPEWVKVLSRTILLNDLSAGMKMTLRNQNHPLVAAVAPAYSSPVETIKDFELYSERCKKGLPPEKLACCKTPLDVLRRLTLDHIHNAGLYVQQEDVAPHSEHHVTIALSKQGFVRVYVAHPSLGEKREDLVAGRRNPLKVFQGLSGILSVEALDDVIALVR
jgi:hypothetical protein